MTSFGYRLNPRYAIKECLSCGALYTQNCSCSKGNIEDKTLVPRPPKNCARCAKCGYLADGPNCQGCALLRRELEENLVTHSPDFQNTFEPSNASTNVVNAPREPYVVKQNKWSFVDKISFDLNRAPDSPNKFHCFHCKDVLRDGEACKRCTCAKCGSGLGKGHCFIYGHNQNSLNDSLSISETSSQSPPNIDHCCYECGDPLDDIFCKQCTYKSCGEGAHIGYNCPPKVPIIPNSEAESPFTLDSTPTYVDESPNVFNLPPQPPVYPCEFCGNDAYFGHYCTPQAQFNNPEQGYSQDLNFTQNIHNFQQQYLCCEQCGGPHETFQCQQINFYKPCCENCRGLHENFQCQSVNYCEPNLSYGSYYLGCDQFGDFHPQQYLCCENCEGPHETFQCQLTNEDYCYEQNSCYNSNSFGSDQCQPAQYTVNHPIFDAHNDFLKS
nr:hypothetical protein [Tanacetum cinerariifolium]